MGDETDSAERPGEPEPGRESKPKPEARPKPEPDLSGEEFEVGWGERPREPGWLSEDEERLHRERPPHWE